MRGRLYLLLAPVLCAIVAQGASASQVTWALHSEPRTLDPVLVEDGSSEAVRYLTQGALVRMNRKSQALEPELATFWKVSQDGRSITFRLRKDVHFSDGSAFSAADVLWSMDRLMDPAVHAPVASTFQTAPGRVTHAQPSADTVVFTFPGRVVGLAEAFESVPIQKAGSHARSDAPVLGPYQIGHYERGSYLLLRRNPYYWKRDLHGRRLPYIDEVRLVIQQNRELELAQYLRGDFQLINDVSPEQLRVLGGRASSGVLDLGPSLDSEQMWFNQVPTAPIPDYKRAWFQSTEFRKAISSAINREDLVRLALEGHGTPARGPISPANHGWFDASLKPLPFSDAEALQWLGKAGFQKRGDVLFDQGGRPVEFSLITNAGNQVREKMATLIQEDLGKIGIKVRLVTLDFPALIQRITQSFDYDACLLGLVNVDPDPNGQMNVWLSSSPNHQWNPQESTPATKWEAEIDALMKRQAGTSNLRERKQAVDRFQQIVREQEPFIYLVNRNSLVAVSPRLVNAQPAILFPQTFWRAEWMQLQPR